MCIDCKEIQALVIKWMSVDSIGSLMQEAQAQHGQLGYVVAMH